MTVRFLWLIGFATFASFTFLSPSRANAQIELFVATDGSDAASGSPSEPLATIDGARRRIAAIRSHAEYQPQAICVTVRGGLYELSQPLEFTEADSGSADFPVTYRVAPDTKVVLRGGATIERFHSVGEEQCEYAFPKKDHVWRVDLTSFDLPGLDSSSTSSRSRDLHREMEADFVHLVVNGRMQSLARWPDTGWANTTDVGQDNRSWSAVTHDLGKADIPYGLHAWAHGFWTNDWEDACHRIEFATVGSKTKFRFCQNVDCQVKAGARYRIENVATQLNQDGEWFLDVESKQAYVYCEQSEPESAFVSRLACPVSFYGVSHLNFFGFTIEGASNCGVEIAGGERVSLSGCEIRHVGNTCVHIFHGEDHAITDCKLHDAGAGGVRIEAGDRSSLTPANHRIANNLIHHFSQLHLAYRPAVNAIGVGITIEGNTIHDGPHAAIILEGNDHVVAKNKISHVCLETDDAGAIYIGGNPTYRGNRIVDNHVHNLGQSGRTGVVGIYLDDFTSGTTVTGNLLQAMPRGIAIGGGRDNLVENNIVLDCMAAIQADARGTTWASGFLADSESGYLPLCHDALSHEAFAARYPELAATLDDSPELPKGNRIIGNWIDSGIGIDLQDAPTKQLVTTERNVSKALRYLVDRGDGRFELNASGEALLAENVLEFSRYVRFIDTNNESSPSDKAQ